MVHIDIVNIYSCTELDNELKPANIKTVFNQLDENIIVWGKALKVKHDTEISMEWYNPDNVLIFTITINIEATNEQRPFRYFWSIMQYKLIHAIEGKKYGKWTVKIIPFDIVYEFLINELTVAYENKIKSVSSISFFDKTM